MEQPGSQKGEILGYPLDNIEVEVVEQIAFVKASKTRVIKVKFENEVVVLKAVPRAYLKTKKKVEHMYNEKQILGLLEHPNMPRL